MADLTDIEFVRLRSQVGTGYSEPELQAAYDNAGTLKDAAILLIETRLSDFRMDPAQFQAVGLYQQNTAKNIEALTAKLTSLRRAEDDLSGTTGGTNIVPNDRYYSR